MPAYIVSLSHFVEEICAVKIYAPNPAAAKRIALEMVKDDRLDLAWVGGKDSTPVKPLSAEEDIQ